MSAEELVRWLKHVYVWIPGNNKIRNEIKEVVARLGGHIP
jgi:hypothetical protein